MEYRDESKNGPEFDSSRCIGGHGVPLFIDFQDAIAESFFSLLESELLQQRVFKIKADSSIALFTYVEARNNRVRRHGAFAQRSPLAFEEKFTATTAVEYESKAHAYLDPNINEKSSTASIDAILTVMQSS